jgi:hypothetical protein
MSKFQTIARALAPAIAIAAALMCGGAANAADDDPFPTGTEGFDDVESLFSRAEFAWTRKNNSTAPDSDWAQGGIAFDAHQQGPDAVLEEGTRSYIAAGFDSTKNTGEVDTISNWLISPTLFFVDGDIVTFRTRTVDTRLYADRLQVLFSNVGGTNVGTSPTDVGDFTTVLEDINPTYLKTGYPNDPGWAEYTVTINLSGPTNGAFAFRYFVENGGPGSTTRSDYIGIDTVSTTAGPPVEIPAVPEPATYLMMALGLGAIGVRRMRATRS